MAVAWIGDREASISEAVEHTAQRLRSSHCPVFTFDTDIHGTREAIRLAELAGAAYDLIDSGPTARETALYTDKGGMFVASGEVRRRADVLIIVGALPSEQEALVEELARSAPDLGGGVRGRREVFVIGSETWSPTRITAVRLSFGDAEANAVLAAIRAQLADRQTTASVSNFDRFAAALAAAKFPVFLFSGHSTDRLGLEMLQGLIGDLNRKARVSGLHLPASENGWGSTLASTWMTGFALRTGFSRGFPDFDPWRFDAARMVADGEADFQLWVSGQSGHEPTVKPKLVLVALANVSAPVAAAAVTIAIGEPGVDHDSVRFCARTGTLRAIETQAASDRPSAASILGMMRQAGFAAQPC